MEVIFLPSPFSLKKVNVVGSHRNVILSEHSQVRVQEAKGLPPQISTEGFMPRFEEFRNFEESFADCLSKAAVKTKFAQHCNRGEQVRRRESSRRFDIPNIWSQLGSLDISDTIPHTQVFMFQLTHLISHYSWAFPHGGSLSL